MSDWPTVTLKEAGVALIDCDHKTPKAQEQGLPYVGIPQLKEGRITLDGARLITEEDFNHWRRKAKPTPDDVILSRRCNPGETAYVPEGLEIALGQNLVLLRSDGEKLYPPFLRWVVQGTNWWNQVGKFINVGAVFDSLKCADIPNFEIQLPPMDAQIKIAEILGGLDKKIELNRQINQTLEQIAQAIFKSWFVDFEPVKAKIEAKQNGQNPERAAMRAISGKTDEELDAHGRANAAGAGSAGAADQLSEEQRQQLTTTAALFPDEFEDSELGEIPKGWIFDETQNNFEVRDGTHDSPKQADTGFPLVTSRHITSGIIDFSKTYLISEEDYEQVNKRSKVETLDILLTMIGTVGESLLVQKEEINFAIKNVGLFKTSQNPSFAFYFYLLLRTSLMKQYLESRMAGTTQKYLTLKALRSIPILFPGKQVLDRFNQLVVPMFEKIHCIHNEIEALTSIRDLLLPKLLSGEITLGDLRSTSEAVA